jgi:hypothetical protein
MKAEITYTLRELKESVTADLESNGLTGIRAADIEVHMVGDADLDDDEAIRVVFEI